MKLPSPIQIKQELPLQACAYVAKARETAIQILQRKDPRLAIIMGPCSIHDTKSALEYATRLKALSQRLPSFFPIMRVFVEKPRTQLDWKGMLYDPLLDGSHDILMGIRKSRQLLLDITHMGVPCAMELLEPNAVSYFDDLLVWGLIGARTSASQPHRQMASSLSFPVGFKNDLQGQLDVAVSSIISSQAPHSYLGIDSDGHIATIRTSGNPFTHLVLRGTDSGPNYHPDAIEDALERLESRHLQPTLLIDCSHGNCNKDYKLQKGAFGSVMKQAALNPSIAGMMLESHLFSGKQPLLDDPERLTYGVSITDSCLGWEETEELLHCAWLN